jgi:SpoVK/Ycf46/Vps4 family AAA+-type ATPase
MSSSNDQLQPLREALEFSPENVPLRKHLGTLLLKLGRLDEAEREFRTALAKQPDSSELKLCLASVFLSRGELPKSLVLVEDVLKNDDSAADAHLLYARLMLRSGEIREAVSHYRWAVDPDDGKADAELEKLLGIEDDEDTESEVYDGRIRLRPGGGESPRETVAERPTITFADVGGMDELKEEIRLKIIYPLAHADLYQAYGKQIGGGILLYGPPGCGKTHLARATAGEIKASFISVGISEVLDMWLGASERNLHEIFETARRSTPAVLFFDEVDALGASRTDMRHSAGRHLINQFLAEMDGVRASNEGVLILGATNAPWHLDAAFRRPGRFSQVLFVPPPDAPARRDILSVLSHGKPVDSIDFDAVGKRTEGFSGADLKAVVDAAIEAKLREALRTGARLPLTTKDFLAAAKALRPSTGDWFSTARNHALYSNQGGAYDDILKYLRMK